MDPVHLVGWYHPWVDVSASSTGCPLDPGICLEVYDRNADESRAKMGVMSNISADEIANFLRGLRSVVRPKTYMEGGH
jgi:hypothetical protein